MICKFNHDGDCCNSGSPQYMCKGKPNLCHSAVPMTRGDRIRTMSDHELAAKNVRGFSIVEDYDVRVEYSTSDARTFDDRREAIKHELDWLRQPAEE